MINFRAVSTVLVILEALLAFKQLVRCHILSLEYTSRAVVIAKCCTSDPEVHMELKAMGHSKDYYMHTDCAGTSTCLYT